MFPSTHNTHKTDNPAMKRCLDYGQKLVLIALLTGKVLPTSKTLGDLLANNTLHPGDPILLDTEDILETED